MEEQSTNYGFLWVFLIVAILFVARYLYKHSRKDQNSVLRHLIENLDPNTVEIIESLSKQDIVNYFKSMTLRKGQHLPFISRIEKNGKDIFMLAVWDEVNDEITNCKLLEPRTVNADVLSLLGNEKLVVLN